MRKLFIHIQKNGGMTIRHSDLLKKKVMIVTKDKLISPDYLQRLNRTMKSLGDHHGIGHARYRDVKDWTKEHGAFAIVRNPWSKVVSRYLFAKQSIENGASPVDYADVRSLDHFIEERHKWADKEFLWHRAIRGWFPQLDHVVNSEEKVSCDIIRLEHMDSELCDYFGLQRMTDARNITTIKKDYKDLYNDKTIQIIADWYKKDIEYWGFDFDSSAQKNYWSIGK